MESSSSPIVKLENDHLLVEIARPKGVILRIRDKASGMELAPMESMAENFQLIVELNSETTAIIKGSDQPLSDIDLSVRRYHCTGMVR